MNKIGVVSNTTPAGLHQAMMDKHYDSIAIVSSEGDEVFSSGLSKDTTILNSLWSGDEIRKSRYGKKTKAVYKPLTILALSQPKVGSRIFKSHGGKVRDIGFLARCLMCEPPSMIGLRMNNYDPQSYENLDRTPVTENIFDQRIGQLVKDDYIVDKDTVGAAYASKVLKFDHAACECLVGFSNKIEADMRPAGPLEDYRDYGSKCADNTARIAANIHCINETDPANTLITLDTVSLAIDISCYFLSHFMVLNKGLTEVDINAQKLSSYFTRQKDMGIRYIRKSYLDNHSPIRKVFMLNSALNLLKVEGRIELISMSPNNGANKARLVIDLFPAYPKDNQKYARMYNGAEKA